MFGWYHQRMLRVPGLVLTILDAARLFRRNLATLALVLKPHGDVTRIVDLDLLCDNSCSFARRHRVVSEA